MTTQAHDMTVGMGATLANSFAGWQAAVDMHRWRDVLKGAGIASEEEGQGGAVRLLPWSWWVARDGTVKGLQGFPTGTTGDDRRPIHSCRGALGLPETVTTQGQVNVGEVFVPETPADTWAKDYMAKAEKVARAEALREIEIGQRLGQTPAVDEAQAKLNHALAAEPADTDWLEEAVSEEPQEQVGLRALGLWGEYTTTIHTPELVEVTDDTITVRFVRNG